MKKRKIGVILILVGIGISLVLYQLRNYEDNLVIIDYDFEIPYKYALCTGIILILIGVGMITFSFFPKEEKESNKNE